MEEEKDWVKKLDEDIRKYQSTQKYKNWAKKQERKRKAKLEKYGK